MADTPRTLAEVLTLFADNTTEDISPQDLRDFVVSLTDPVSDGGFGRIPSKAFSAQASPGQPLNLTVQDGLSNGISLPLGDAPNLIDPDGMLSTTTIMYYTVTLDPGDAVQPPPGVWAYSLQTYWDTDTTGVRQTDISNYDERIEQPGQTLDPWLGDPTFGGWPTFSPFQVDAAHMEDKGSYRVWQMGGIIRIPPTYTDPVWVFYVAQNSGSPRTLIGFTVNLLQVTA